MDGRTHQQIANELGFSEDWASGKVRELREGLARHVLENAGDELGPELRARLEAFLPG